VLRSLEEPERWGASAEGERSRWRAAREAREVCSTARRPKAEARTKLPEPCSREVPEEARLPDSWVAEADPSEDSLLAQSCPTKSFAQELNLELEPTFWKGSRKHLDLNHLGHSFFGDLLGRGVGPPQVCIRGIGLCAPWARHKIGWARR